MPLEDWGRWVAQQERAMSGSTPQDGSSQPASTQSFNFRGLPAELREYIWETATQNALNEAARSLPDELVREIGFEADGYHQAGCRCHPFWRYLRPLLAACRESRAAVSRYTDDLMKYAGKGEDGNIVQEHSDLDHHKSIKI